MTRAAARNIFSLRALRGARNLRFCGSGRARYEIIGQDGRAVSAGR